MEELFEGARVLYQLSEEDAKNINQYIADHPDQQPPDTRVENGQRVQSVVVLSRGPDGVGEERLVVRLNVAGPEDKAYHIWADDVTYDDGAWRTK